MNMMNSAENASAMAHIDLACNVIVNDLIARQPEAMSHQRDFQRVIFDNLASGVVACNAEGTVTFLNRAAREFHGLPETDLPLEQWAEHAQLYCADGLTPLPLHQIPLLRALRGETVQDVELVIALKTGKPRLTLSSACLLTETDGTIVGAVVSIRDISSFKASEEKRARQAIEEAQRLAAEAAGKLTAQVLESIFDSFFVLDTNWCFTYMNSQAVELFQRPREELLGKNIWTEFPDAIGTTFQQQYQLAVTEQRAVSFEDYYQPFDMWFKVRAFPLPSGLSVYFENVSEIRRVREALRAQEEWMRATLTSIGEGLIATKVDVGGTIVFMNPVAEMLTGWTLEQAKGRPVLDVLTILNQKTREPAANPVQRVIEEGKPVELANHTALLSKSGREFIIECTAAPVKNDTCKLTGVVLVFRDATDLHRFRDQAKVLARVIESSPSFVSVATPNGQTYFVNQWGRALVGLTSKEEAKFIPLLAPFPETEKERFEHEVMPTLQKKETWEGEISLQHFTRGEMIPVQANAFSIVDEETGDLKAYAFVATDLRERMRLEKERATATGRMKGERERLFRLLNQAPLPVAMFEGPEHVFVLANPSYIVTFFGSGDLLGKPVREAMPEAKAQEFPKLLDEVYRTGVAIQGTEVRSLVTQGDGSLKQFYVNFTYQPMFTLDGEVEGILSVSYDVTALVEARTLIEANEEIFRSLADSMPQLVWTANGAGEIDYVNRGYLEYTGLSKEEIQNWRHQGFIHLEDLPRTRKEWDAALATGDHFQSERRLRRADGTFRWFLVRAVPSKNVLNNIVKWFGSCTDIHDQKRLSVELERAKTYAENATKAKSAFLANMSHEIRTPLGVILGFSEFLLDPHQTISDRDECVTTIRRNACQLSQLINDLLDLSKVEADKLEIEKVQFSLCDVIQDVDRLLSNQARAKGISLRFLSAGPVQRTVTTDPSRLRQVLVNIVGNAIKFTERGGVDVRIGMHPSRDESDSITLSFAVRDSGIGLTSEQAQRIWEPFVQADSSTTRKFGGTGLGLSLSRKLARALGGDLVVTTSEVGIGSTFTITIEAGLLETASFLERDANAEEFTSKVTGPGGQELSLAGARVLLVEDSTDNQLLVKRLLTREGALVDIAIDGVEGVSKALAGDYDVVLMDIQMPRLDGYQATAQLRTQGYLVPIIALTAHAMKGDREHAMANGFVDHMTKPIDRKLILEKVKNFFQQKSSGSVQPESHI